MVILTFGNNKGGVGKTTSALAVAHRLAELNHRTLLIDADPQGNSTVSLPEAPSTGSLAHAIAGDSLHEYIHAISDHLWHVPAGKNLAKEEKTFGNSMDYFWFLRDKLAAIAAGEGGFQFDYVIIDTGPNLGPLTLSALIASDYVFIPMLPNLYSTEGMNNMLERVANIRKNPNLNPKLRVGGIFFTKYARSYRKAIHNSYVQDMESDPALEGLIMERTIRDNVKLDEAPNERQSIYDWAPDSNGAHDYRALTDEILTRIA